MLDICFGGKYGGTTQIAPYVRLPSQKPVTIDNVDVFVLQTTNAHNASIKQQ